MCFLLLMIFLITFLFSGLRSCENTVYITYNTLGVNELCMVSVRLLLKSSLLVVKFLGELKVMHGFSIVWGGQWPKPHVVGGSTV